MQHSPLNSKTQLIDNQNKLTRSKLSKPNNKSDLHLIIDQVPTTQKTTQQTTSEPSVGSKIDKSRSESTLRPTNVIDPELNPKSKPTLYEQKSCSNNEYTFRIELKIHSSVYNAFKVCFYYIYLIIVYLK